MPPQDHTPQFAPSRRTRRLRALLVLLGVALIAIGWVFWLRAPKPAPKNTNGTAGMAGNANTNAAANVNAATNTNTAGTSETSADEWRTVTYQRADHGFTVSVPNDWTTYDAMGLGDSGELTSLCPSRAPCLRFSFFTVGGGVAWYEAEQRNLATDGATVAAGTEAAGTASVQTITTRRTWPDGKIDDSIRYYFPRDNRVYVLFSSGTKAEMEEQRATRLRTVRSFTFIDPAPFVRIRTESKKQRVGGTSENALTVTWQAPVRLNLVDAVFDAVVYERPLRRDYYKVGTVAAGTYQGQAIVDVFETGQGPGGQALFRVAYDETAQRFIYLEQHSDSLLAVTGAFRYDATATIPGLVLPDTLDIPNSKQKLVGETYPANTLFQDLQNLQTVFTHTTAGAIWFDPKQRCFVAAYPDGTVRLYHYLLSFQQPTEENVETTSFVPNVRWSDGTAVTEEYTINAPTGGCGPSTCQTLYTETEVGGREALALAGSTADGDPVYEYKDRNHQVLKDIYEEYAVPEIEGRDLTYEQFVAAHPIFFWRDPFGRWLRFRQFAFLRAAECGKPVIYLYPEQTTDVRVQVRPTGGFTHTEPAYPDGGWTVRAQPDGTLTAPDGRTYPYLFWEGVGLNYQRPREGFVVSERDVPSFLQEKLTLLGLNEQERADFEEYWQPRLQQSPYVFVTFVAKQDFDRLAPLSVEPKPDTVIRVFMDYEPLVQPRTVQPQRLTAPERRGFTVVEWGGAIHR